MATRSPAEAQWGASEDCVFCLGADYTPGYGPRTLVTCEACLDRGTHVECWQRAKGSLITQEDVASPAFQWFCSEARPRRWAEAAAAAAAVAAFATCRRWRFERRPSRLLAAGLRARQLAAGGAHGQTAARAGRGRRRLHVRFRSPPCGQHTPAAPRGSGSTPRPLLNHRPTPCAPSQRGAGTVVGAQQGLPESCGSCQGNLQLRLLWVLPPGLCCR